MTRSPCCQRAEHLNLLSYFKRSHTRIRTTNNKSEAPPGRSVNCDIEQLRNLIRLRPSVTTHHLRSRDVSAARGRCERMKRTVRSRRRKLYAPLPRLYFVGVEKGSDACTRKAVVRSKKPCYGKSERASEREREEERKANETHTQHRTVVREEYIIRGVSCAL